MLYRTASTLVRKEEAILLDEEAGKLPLRSLDRLFPRHCSLITASGVRRLPLNHRMSADTLRIMLRQEYLDLMRAGQKIMEGRLAKPAYRSIATGQVVTFYSDDDTLDVLVEGVTLHATFRDMLEVYGVASFLPQYRDLDRAVALYRSFPGYAEGEEVYGACAIKVAVKTQ